MARHGGGSGGTATLAPGRAGSPAGGGDAASGWEDIAVWDCACGYVNAGSTSCAACGAGMGGGPRDPRGARDPEPGRRGGQAPGTTVPTAARSGAGAGAGRTVVGIIGLNIVQQIVLLAIATSQGMEPGAAIRLSLVAGLVFYGIAALWVLARSTVLGVRAATGIEGGLAGAAEGAVVGVGLAVVLVAGARLAAGHPVLDPVAALLTTQGTVAFLGGALLIAVLAPLVEELVFRGFLAEAMRPRGKWAAVVVSAAAFGVAHLRFAQFRYYVGMGVVLALVYWRRGLVGSVAAHACFNGMLVVAALAASHGPAVVLEGAGASITVPAAWHAVGSGGPRIAAVGPAGARIDVGRIDVGVPLDARGLADAVVGRRFSAPPGTSIDPGSVGLLELPAGNAVMMRATVGSHEGRVVLLPRGTIIWIATVETAGSDRAARDFQRALSTLRLS
jgi:membrane protease YdiL (CAAX protease family)